MKRSGERSPKIDHSVRFGQDSPSSRSLADADAWAAEARHSLLGTIFDKFTVVDLMVRTRARQYPA